MRGNQWVLAGSHSHKGLFLRNVCPAWLPFLIILLLKQIIVTDKMVSVASKKPPPTPEKRQPHGQGAGVEVTKKDLNSILVTVIEVSSTTQQTQLVI